MESDMLIKLSWRLWELRENLITFNHKARIQVWTAWSFQDVSSPDFRLLYHLNIALQAVLHLSTAALPTSFHLLPESQKLLRPACSSWFNYPTLQKTLQQNTFPNELLLPTRKEGEFPGNLLVILTARSFLKSSVSGSSRSSRKLYSGSSSSSASSKKKQVLNCYYPAPGPSSRQEQKLFVHCLTWHKEGWNYC